MQTKEADAVSNLLKFLTSTGAGQVAGRAALGAGAGAYLGHEVTPRMFGYEGDPAATNMSTLLDAALYGTLAGMGPAGMKKLVHKQGPVPLVGGITGSELLPVGMHMAQEGTKAVEAGTQAMNEFNPPTISQQAMTALQSPTARGAGVGAGLAALSALVTGMTRAKSDKERIESASRGGMVGKDFLKYVIPAMAAGGVLGSLGGSSDERQPE